MCDLWSCKEGGSGDGIGLERLFPEGGLWVDYDEMSIIISYTVQA